MAILVSSEDVMTGRVEKTGRSGLPYWRTSFMEPGGDQDPQVYLVENSPGATISSHFHDVDEFQVFVKGDGELGQTAVRPYSVHFARAFTNYGPIESRGGGLGWMTLRPRRDRGAKMIDTHREALLHEKKRRPWQRTVSFEYPDAGATGGQVASQRVLDGEFGLSVVALTLGPGQSALAGDPMLTSCQYVLVTSGSLMDGDRQRGELTVVHVGPAEEAFRVMAGPAGLQCLVLNFPLSGSPREAQATDHGADQGGSWHCELCGFVYEPGEGLPAQGIPAGTSWAAVPDDFRCPDCAASKPHFTPLSFD